MEKGEEEEEEGGGRGAVAAGDHSSDSGTEILLRE